MVKCNSTITPSETKIKIEGTGDEELVDPTMFRQLIGSLRYCAKVG